MEHLLALEAKYVSALADVGIVQVRGQLEGTNVSRSRI